MDSATYDKLIADFYRAATGALSWDKALDGVCIAFGARCAPLETVDLGTSQLISINVGGQDLERALLDYIRDYQPINPRVPVFLAAPLGHWTHCHDVLDEKIVNESRFYQDYVPAYDMRYCSGVMMAANGDNVISAFSVQLPHRRGPLNPDERHQIQRLGEHLNDALIAYERVRKLMAQTLAGHALLLSFAYPMWLVDTERFVFFANAAAEREEQDSKRVGRRGACLALMRLKMDRELTIRIKGLSDAGHGATTVLDMRRSQSDPPTWLHLSLLIPGKVLGAFGDRPLILATLFDPLQVSSLDPFALANMFRLTPAEGKVAAQIADGMTPNEIAIENGTRVSTVRSQVSNVLAKLGVARQADVVRVLRQGEALWARVPQTGSL